MTIRLHHRITAFATSVLLAFGLIGLGVTATPAHADTLGVAEAYMRGNQDVRSVRAVVGETIAVSATLDYTRLNPADNPYGYAVYVLSPSGVRYPDNATQTWLLGLDNTPSYEWVVPVDETGTWRVWVYGYDPLSTAVPPAYGDTTLEQTAGYTTYKFDVTVKNSAGTPIPGRVWTTTLYMNQAVFSRMADLDFYVVQPNGVIYRAQYHEYDGIISNITYDSLGVVATGTCESAYFSWNSVKTPGYGRASQTACGAYYKIFFDYPAADLPASILPTYTDPAAPIVSYTQGSSTSAPWQGTVSMTTTGFLGTMTVSIDADGDNVFTGSKDVSKNYKVTTLGAASTWAWDGKDATGAVVPATTPVHIKATYTGADEIHSNIYDVEWSGGQKWTQMVGGAVNKNAGKPVVMPLSWDDSKIDSAPGSVWPSIKATDLVPGQGGNPEYLHYWDVNGGVYDLSDRTGESDATDPGNDAWIDTWLRADINLSTTITAVLPTATPATGIVNGTGATTTMNPAPKAGAGATLDLTKTVVGTVPTAITSNTGKVSANTDGTVTITTGTGTVPAGVYSIPVTYYQTDGNHYQVACTVTVVNNDTATTAVNAATTVDVLANDGNSGTGLTITTVSTPTHGTATITSGKISYTPAANYSGTDSFTYTAKDTAGQTATATVTMNVTPKAVNDAATTPAGTSVTVDAVANDLGTGLTVASVTQPSHGSVTVTGGKISYTPAAGFSGVDSLTYTAKDAAGQTATATVTITVTPTAPNDLATTVAGAAVTIDVLANDSGTGLTITTVSTPTHGTATITSGIISYTPAATYSGTDSFTYTAKDTAGQTVTATVTVTVTPKATDDTATTPAGTSVTVDAVANDLGTGLTVASVTQPSHGSVTVTGGKPVYTPASGFSGVDTFTYAVKDSVGQTATATVTVTVSPTAIDDTATTPANTAVTIDATGNDLGTGVALATLATPAHGTATITGGKIVYTPASGFSGVDSFAYTLKDASGRSAGARVTVTVTPTATNDTATTATGVSVPIQATNNDIGAGLTVTSVTQPVHGTVTITGGQPVYTPTAGFSGVESFTYTVTDSSGQAATATITITVTPTAADDTATTSAGTPVTIDVTANDLGTGMTPSGATQPSHGTVTITGGAIVYTPAHGFSGVESFTYTAKDTSGQQATATVTVTVTPKATNNTGTASTGSSVTIDVVGDDLGAGLVLASVAQPAHGSVTFTGATLTYTPFAGFSGLDAFTYTIRDSAGQTSTATVTVTVSPAAADDTATTTAGTPVSIDVLGNDNGSSLILVSASTPAHGTATITGGKVVYTPAIGFSGLDTFTYTAKDGIGQTLTATTTVTVAPTAVDDTTTTQANTPATVAVLANDTGTGLTLTSVSTPTHGSTTITGGTILYTPSTDYSGPDSFAYTATDGIGQATNATVTVTVTPTATGDIVSTTSGTPVPITVLANDHGTGLTIDTTTAPAHGAISVKGGTITYTPSVKYSGADTFTYTIKDAAGQRATATVTIMVVPVAPDDAATTPVNTPVQVDVLANDSGSGLTLTTVSTPSHGSAAITSGTVTYTPVKGYTGLDSFTYTATDSTGQTLTATVWMTVTPTAVDDTATTTASTTISIDAITNDLGSGLTVTGATHAPHGAVAIRGGKLEYTPATGFSGVDLFPYTVTDAAGQQASATVTVTVVPVAVGDTTTTPADTPVDVDVTANDLGSHLSVSVVGAPAHGAVTLATGIVTYTPAHGYSGPDTFTYEVIDSSGQKAATTVHVTVTPVANPDTVTLPSGSTVTVNNLGNDLGSGLTLTSVTGCSHGTTVISGGKTTVTYVPTAGYSGTDSCAYAVEDTSGQTTTSTITVTVTPVATPDTATTKAGQSVTVPVLDNDLGSSLTVTSVTGCAHGTAVISGGKVAYSPSKGFSGTDTCAYTAGDASGQTTTSTITVTVTPVATPDTATTKAGQSVTVPVLGNDLGSSLTVTSVTGCAHGTATIIAQGTSVVYAPAAGYSGTDSCAYAAEDASGQTTTSTITVTVTPVATPDTATTKAGQSVTVPVLGNDLGSSLTVTSVTGCAHGTATIIAQGTSVVYAPEAGFSGTDTCAYTAGDTSGQTTTSTITVTVTPVATPDTATTKAGQSVTVPVLGNDLGSSLTVTSVTGCAHGTAVISGGKVAYSPSKGFSGTDTCAYTAGDASGQTTTSTITVTVTPVATPDTATTTAGTPVTVLVLDNDLGSGLTLTSVTGCSHGTATIAAQGTSVVYAPAAGYSGTDSCAYAVEDTSGQTTASTITVTVTPVAVDDTATIPAGDQVTIPVLDNDQGADLMVTKVAGCAHGDAIVRDNQVVYRPGDMFSGTDTCSYDVRDGTGQTTTAVITVTVTPVAMDDDATTHADTPVTVPVLDNDRGTDLVVADSVACDYGQADIGDGGILTYTPETGRSGIATCQYEATDDSGQADTATVTITVMPVAVDDTASTTAGDPIAIPVVDNDTGTHLVVTGTTCDHGTAAIDDNTVVYQSTNEFSGTGMCAYTITDGDGLTDTARITVTVTALHADTGGAIEARGRFPLALGIALILAGAAGLTRRQAASM